MNQNRSWARGYSAAPIQPDTELRGAAKHLRLMATRFLAGNALPSDVDEAVRSWQVAKAKSGSGGSGEVPQVREA
jgi:hypothetical protein